MTLLEHILLGGGVLSFAVFLLRTVAPYLRSRLDSAADTTSKNLREEFCFFSHQQVRNIFLAVGGITAVFAMFATGNTLLPVVIGISPMVLSGAVVRQISSRRRKKIVSQLPTFLEIVAGHVKAGHSVPEALQEAISLLPSGIKEEVSWLCRTVRLGTSLPDALLLWEQRMQCEEISLVVHPLRIAIPAGGNIFGLLGRCRDILQAKMRVTERMRTMTSQARLQAAVLTLLPPGFIAVLGKIEPNYLGRCLGTAQGKTILAFAGTLQVLGWVFIRRIVKERK